MGSVFESPAEKEAKRQRDLARIQEIDSINRATVQNQNAAAQQQLAAEQARIRAAQQAQAARAVAPVVHTDSFSQIRKNVGGFFGSAGASSGTYLGDGGGSARGRLLG